MFFASDKYRFNYLKAEESPNYTTEQNIDLAITLAAGAADTKIVDGKLEFGAEYLVSRGKSLERFEPGLKPDVVCEYSGHWPCAFCYLYKL